MPDILFKAFLSCSLATEDSTVVDVFRSLVRSFDIEPFVYDYQEVGRIPDKLKEHIINSDCLIAIATRRQKLEGSDLWACPDWIQHEIALANAYKKPIAIFVEEGVTIDGLIAIEERRQPFSRDNLLKNIDKVTRFLFNLRSYLESLYRFDKLHLPVLIRHYLRVKEEIRQDDTTVERCEVLMECLAEELEATHHSTQLEDLTPGLSVRPKQFDFICKEKPSGMKAEAQIIQEGDLKFLWQINFSPPLRKGQKVKYASKLVKANTRPATLEILMERIRQGTYEYKEPICEGCEWTIAYPTAEFQFELEFPENYEIFDYYADVRMGDADLKAPGEVKRIREGNMLLAEKLIDKWVLGLRIPKPLQDHTYYIYYTPPQSKA